VMVLDWCRLLDGEKAVSTGSLLSLCTFCHQVSKQGCSCFS
jgi:hypothetical protein